jgi:ribA/ribD-fused uncharacterized protein
MNQYKYIITKYIMETETEIYFYGLKNDFGYMSNFYKINFIDKDGIKYHCSEQYFMYHKCKIFDPSNNILLQTILTEKSATKIKQCGRQVKNYNDIIWKEKRYNIMLEALRLKFNQNEIIKQKLLETKPKILYEASKNDKIWGIGFYDKDAINNDKSKFGTNLLGKALMEIRNEL